MQELPDWEALREAGRAIKDAALRHLDDYLLAVRRRRDPGGGHRPLGHATPPRPTRSSPGSSAATARKEVVKIKSLTTDEIGLNEALGAEPAIEAIETDLAELIIQLAGERSSHILVPAIHKNRSEIRDLFTKQLGTPQT